jgi:hypothetical protein
MSCPNCGTLLAAGTPYCSTCGANLSHARGLGVVYQPQPQVERTSGMAIAGFVLSLFACSLLGLIFSIVGYSECKKSFGAVKGERMAVAGIIVSIAWIVIFVAWAAAIGSRHHRF